VSAGSLARPAALWRIRDRDPVAEDRLARELGLPSLVASVLVGRGFADPEAADAFVRPNDGHFHDPRLLPDFDRAAAVLLDARDRKQTVYVHGDYDVDGVTSTALFARFLRRIEVNVVPHVPHRMREGYGVSDAAVGWAREAGADVFLTCDCGVSAVDQVKAAREAGMRVVVTDHHHVPPRLPEAEALVNPHRSGSVYPWTELSGAGVAFKVCEGLARELDLPLDKFRRAYLDLVAMGTIADVVPLLDENRVIARLGLPEIGASRKLGVQALLEVSGLSGKPVTARHVGFQLGPRINAVGRIDDAGTALELLLTEEPGRARELAQILEQTNQERRDAQNRAVEEAVEAVLSAGLQNEAAIVVADDSWHPGIIGLIAGRLVERFRRPAFVISRDGSVARGSARSIEGFHLAEAVMAQVGQTLLGGGGHEMAAGFSIDPSRIEEFSDAVRAHAGSLLGPDDFRPKVDVDVLATAAEADARAAESLALLEPYGAGNPEPVFAVRSVRVGKVAPTSNPDHVRVGLDTDAGPRTAMGFGMGSIFSEIGPGSEIDVAFTLENDARWGLRWVLKDVQSSEG
jgi:single-stranded-DNA-specific exonuclease